MRGLVFITALLAANPEPLRLDREFRVERGYGRAGVKAYAFLEFAPASGVGMGTACACATVTGAKGETVTATRAGVVDCRAGGPWQVTAIAPGDIAECGANVPRVERQPDGSLGIETWGSAGGTWAQTLLRTNELGNAAWTSTEAVTSNTTAAPDGTTTADTLNDTSGAVQSCTSQTIATTSATKHEVSVYVRAGTLAKAQLKLVGTGSSTGDCTATSTSLGTTYSRLWCQSSSAYAGTVTAVTVSVCVGDAASDTGTVIAWKVNHHVATETTDYPYPSVTATAAAVNVSADVPVVTLPVAMSSTTGSHAISFTPAWSTATASASLRPSLLWYDGSGRPAYGASTTSLRTFDGTNDVANTIAWTGGTTYRVWQDYTGSTMRINDGSDTASGSFDGTFGAAALTSLQVGYVGSTLLTAFGVVSQVCADPSPTRCR